MSNFRYPYQADELVSAKIIVEWKHRKMEIDVTPGPNGPRNTEVSMDWDHNYAHDDQWIDVPVYAYVTPMDSNLTIAFRHVLYEGLFTEKEPA